MRVHVRGEFDRAAELGRPLAENLRSGLSGLLADVLVISGTRHANARIPQECLNLGLRSGTDFEVVAEGQDAAIAANLVVLVLGRPGR